MKEDEEMTREREFQIKIVAWSFAIAAVCALIYTIIWYFWGAVFLSESLLFIAALAAFFGGLIAVVPQDF